MSIKKRVTGIAMGALAAAMISVPAFAVAAFSNGSFETGPDPGAYTTLSAGDTSVTGWTVTSGSVDYIGTYWQSSNGNRDFDMSGNEAGAISQTFSTVAGHTYTVTFDLAGNPDGAPTVKTLNVDTGNGTTGYSFDSTGATHTNMGWQPQTYNFTATGSSTSLTFTSTTAGFYGPALDNVVVTDVVTNKDQCKNNGWKTYGSMFKNQGDCVSFVATGGKNLPAGN